MLAPGQVILKKMGKIDYYYYGKTDTKTQKYITNHMTCRVSGRTRGAT